MYVTIKYDRNIMGQFCFAGNYYTVEDGIIDCRYIMFSVAMKKKKKKTQKGERWSPWKQALFEKLMQ